MPEAQLRSRPLPGGRCDSSGLAIPFPGCLVGRMPLAERPGGALTLTWGSRPLPSPSRSLQLRTPTGMVLFFAVPAPDAGSDDPVWVLDTGEPLARLAVSRGPEPSLAALFDGLTPAAGGALLAWLLDLGQATRLARHPAFAAAILAAARSVCETASADLRPLSATVACLMAPGGSRQPLTATWCLTADGFHRSLFPPARAGALLAHLVERREGDRQVPALLVVRPDDRPLLLEARAAAGTAAAPSLQACLGAAPPPARLALATYLWQCLSPLHRRPGVGAILQGLAALKDAPRSVVRLTTRPVSAALHCVVPTDDGQVFVRGTLIDPERQVERITLDLPYQEPVALDLDRRFDDPAGAAALGCAAAGSRAGFLARLSGMPAVGTGGVTAGATLHLVGGATVACVAPRSPVTPFDARVAVLGGLAPHDLPAGAMAEVLAPVVGLLQRRCLEAPRIAAVEPFGTRPEAPARSIIIPLYQTLDFIRFQLAAFAVDPDMAGSEIVYVLDSPEQRGIVERELRDRCRVLGLAVTLVVMTRNFGYAPAVNAGVSACRGRTLILLNSDVVPTAPGWMNRLDEVAATFADAGATGPRLLFHDGSLQHAGLYFDRSLDGDWLNRHYWKGYPGTYPPAAAVRETPGVTGACVRIDRAVYESVGGLTEDYVIGDYEDSDLCLKLTAAGRRNVYAGPVALHHFERCSISRHDGYERTLVSTYNRWLHAQRWDEAMAAVMARHAAALPGSAA